MIHPNKTSLTLTAVAVLSMEAVTAYAQESQQQDNTGTNPVNFTRDIRVYNEYSILNTEGDDADLVFRQYTVAITNYI